MVPAPSIQGGAVGARTTAALAAAMGVLGPAGATPARASDYPVVYNWPAAIVASEAQPTPPGANDWTCKPSAAHPRPVVLVPGLSGNGGRAHYAPAPLLANNRYCVFLFDYPPPGLRALDDGARGLSAL